MKKLDGYDKTDGNLTVEKFLSYYRKFFKNEEKLSACMGELISVVVSVYNVDRYLKKCIDSIIEQSYKNLEIILVDDGSTDESGKICDKYLSKDERIKVIHKENGGLSDARNVGILHVRGKYISFVDSDDYLHKDYFSYLYSLAQDHAADLSICELDYINSDGKRINHPLNNNQHRIMDQKDALKLLLKQKPYSNSAPGKLFKTSLFEDVKFPYGKIYEDTLTVYKLFLKSSVIVFGARPLYYYLYRNTSISKSSFSLKQMECIYNTKIMISDIVNAYPELEEDAKCRLLDPCIGIIIKIPEKQYPKEFEYALDIIYAIRKSILFSKVSTLKRRIIAALSYLDTNMFVWILRKIMK